MVPRGSTWAVVLAGGSGTRLAALTTGNDGVVVPKQFCNFGAPVSMLERTLERTRAVVPAPRIIPAVIDDHRRWWQGQLSGIPADNILVQPRDRGTGAAILHALVSILKHDFEATLLVLPSDHGIEDEGVLHKTMVTLVEEARHAPEHLVLLGAEPDSAETSYGWIVQGSEDFGRTSSVARFVEKPIASAAEALLRAGALWNTFIFACTARALALLFATSQPGWLWWVLRGTPGTIDDHFSELRLYEESPSLDFSNDVVRAATDRLRVLSLPRCGWTDLGTPERLRSWLNRGEQWPVRPPFRFPARRCLSTGQAPANMLDNFLMPRHQKSMVTTSGAPTWLPRAVRKERSRS